MPADLRAPRADEMERLAEVFFDGLGRPRAPDHISRYRRLLDPDRCLAAVEGGQVVGSAVSTPTTVAMPGARVIDGAIVTGIAVRPTHRRRGWLRRMMRTQLETLRDAGEVVAVLRATEGGIYGRFGYGPIAPELRVAIDRGRGALVESAGAAASEDGYDVELVAPDQLATVLPKTYEALYHHRPGEVARTSAWWDVWLEMYEDELASTSRHWVILRGPGGPAASASYVLKPDDGGMAVDVAEYLAVDPDAYAALWRFCLSVDLAVEVRARVAPDEPLRWMLADPRASRITGGGEGAWGRVLDVAPALRARAYGVDGRLRLGVEDQTLPENTGTYTLEVDGGEAVVTRVEDPPDLTMGVDALASVLWGGTAPSRLAAASRLAARDGQVLALADAMLATPVAPLVQTPL